MTRQELIELASTRNLASYLLDNKLIIGEKEDILKLQKREERISKLESCALAAEEIISNMAINLKESSTTLDGKWPDDRDEAYFITLIDIANELKVSSSPWQHS